MMYSPSIWRLKTDSHVDARFLNLLVLSATPRAGSTLLQRICNARKGTLIWGEQAGLLKRFADIYMDAAQFSTMWPISATATSAKAKTRTCG